MKWPRVSIADLMGTVLLTAVGFAAVTHPTTIAVSAIGTLLQGSLLIAVVGPVLRRGRRQAFWLGFAICGGGYAQLAFDFSIELLPRPQLLTSYLLVVLKDYLAANPRDLDAVFGWATTTKFTGWELFAQAGHSWIALMIGMLGGFLGRAFSENAPRNQ